MPGTDEDLAQLTGAGVAGLLATALAARGEELGGWRLRQVDHRPGCSTTVAVDATARSAAGERPQVLGLSTRRVERPGPGVLCLQAGSREVAVWRLQDDPDLPGLALASDAGAVGALLRSCGVQPGPVRLSVRTYRPRRRAVVEARTPTVRVFLKVVRRPLVGPLARRHDLLRASGLPVPRVLGWTDDGVLVLEALAGTTLRARLRAGGVPAPDGAQLLALLDRLPDAVLDLPARRSWTDDVDHYAGVTAAALPAQAERCARLARRVRATVALTAPREAVHGDLYDTQLLLDGARVCGLLDVDTVGPGRRADDLACLLAHVHVLALREPVHRVSSTALADRWLLDFDRHVDPVDLRARVAGVVLALATGPHRVQEHGWRDGTRARLDLAEAWLDRAQRPGR